MGCQNMAHLRYTKTRSVSVFILRIEYPPIRSHMMIDSGEADSQACDKKPIIGSCKSGVRMQSLSTNRSETSLFTSTLYVGDGCEGTTTHYLIVGQWPPQRIRESLLYVKWHKIPGETSMPPWPALSEFAKNTGSMVPPWPGFSVPIANRFGDLRFLDIAPRNGALASFLIVPLA